MRSPSTCPKCGNDKAGCICPRGSARSSAIEILIFKPDPAIPPEKRGVHENLWIKQRAEQYVSIGVYLEGSDLKYYFFQDCDNAPKKYSSLLELKQALPPGPENIFNNTPKLFVMGHGDGGIYGLCNNWKNPSEVIHGANFNKIITDFEAALSSQHDEIFVTIEACNTDNHAQAARENKEKTFLAQLSETHKNMTFCGTGPWDSNDPQTGYRASGGFPILNAPITSTGGGVWKHPDSNSVIFYNNGYQVVAKKSPFASTKTAKELKINTIACAREIFGDAKEEMITAICANRDVLKIDDLKKVPGFPQNKFEDSKITKLMTQEKQIVEKEKNNYSARVRKILALEKSGEKFSERDVLIISLGLKNLSVFEGNEDLRDKILVNKLLLQLVMVTCGKALIAGPSNDSLIDLLLKNRIDINSVDEKGMTALHYAVQNFYNYRKEPLNLIKKLLDCGANLNATDKDGRSPLKIAEEHSRKENVNDGRAVELLQQRLASAGHDASSIAVLTGGSGFVSQSVAAQRAQPDQSSVKQCDSKPEPGK